MPVDFEAAMARVAVPGRAAAAVAEAQDGAVLAAVRGAFDRGLATAVLVGDPAAIRREADAAGVDISPFEVVPAASGEEAARVAVSLVRDGKAGILMKGLLQTATLMRAVLDRETGLRAGRVLSHVAALHSVPLGRMFLLTDAAMVPYPDLKTKAELIRNAVEAARGLGVERPRVAAVAAIELVNPDMPATLDAALLTMMNRRGQIGGCVVDGPLAMDLAVSEDAARRKGIESDVAGRADILLMHNIDVANSVCKTFSFAGDCLFGGLIMGASAPIVLASRADSFENKLYSLALAAAVGGRG